MEEHRIPREIWLCIFSFCKSVDTIGKVASVCKLWNALSYDISLWISSTDSTQGLRKIRQGYNRGYFTKEEYEHQKQQLKSYLEQPLDQHQHLTHIKPTDKTVGTWHYDEKSSWKPYSKEISDKLEAAFKSKQNRVELSRGSYVLLDKRVEKKSNSKIEKKILRGTWFTTNKHDIVHICTEDYAGRLEKDYQEFLAGRAPSRSKSHDIYGTKIVVDWKNMTVMSRYSNGEKVLIKMHRGFPNK